jgi:hypothetical protein
LDHFGKTISPLINLNASMLKVCLDDRVVENIAEVSERPAFNVVVRALGIAGNPAFSIGRT